MRGLGLAAVEARARPPASRTSPAIMRSSDDLPAPLRPVTSSASPPSRPKAQAGKDLAAAAHAGQVVAGKLHQPAQAPTAPAALAAEDPDIPRICWNDPGQYGAAREKTL